MAFYICWLISIPFWVIGSGLFVTGLLANTVTMAGVKVTGVHALKLRLIIMAYGGFALILAYFISHGIA
jgi:hypothetical protein